MVPVSSLTYVIVQLVLVSAVYASIASNSDYPQCGNCWCVPDENGLGACPSWMPQTVFSDEVINIYHNQIPNNILTLDCNPYEDLSCTTSPPQLMTNLSTAVCALVYDNLSPTNDAQSCINYSMKTFETREAAEAANVSVTHLGSCGLCSTTQDLAVYLREDFTTAGKKCASKGLLDEAKGLACYMDIGLTLECAKIWNYDGIYDGKVCATTCMTTLNDPNNGPPPACALNPCLQCDEDKAGPIFTAFAGRTRRRSGLLSEIVRNCSSIANISHDPCSNPSCSCGSQRQ